MSSSNLEQARIIITTIERNKTQEFNLKETLLDYYKIWLFSSISILYLIWNLNDWQ